MVGVPEEKVPLIRISGLLVKSLCSILKSEKIYAPGVTLSDGIAYEFAEEHGIIKPEHDFERLYLDIASILHDCGKYIAMTDIGERSYDIIMATEIIGLSHHEREIVANIVRFNHSEFVYSGSEEDNGGTLGRDGYIKVAKLTAILRLANSLDRSHKQKLKEVRATLSGSELQLSVSTPQGFLLEEAFFPEASDFFEEIYSIRPLIIRN